jgi:hypothetical protein
VANWGFVEEDALKQSDVSRTARLKFREIDTSTSLIPSFRNYTCARENTAVLKRTQWGMHGINRDWLVIGALAMHGRR